jgi:GLPGLI family protein
MKKIIFILAISFFAVNVNVHAQTFIDKANIEYEYTQNLKKNMGSGMWADMMADKMPSLQVGYYKLTIGDNKSVYKFDRWKEKEKFPEWFSRDIKTVWFHDFTTGKTSQEKDMIGSIINVEDSTTQLEWRLTSESRIIAGFNCKKAVAKIFDSVYVFAFYTEEITVPAGPASINGLPGTILGLTIPRLFSSWIATKVSVNNVDESALKPFKPKKSYTNKTLRKFIDDRTSDWWQGDDEKEENKQQKNRFIWGMLM